MGRNLVTNGFDAPRRSCIPRSASLGAVDVDASIEQVTGILVREGLRYSMSADGRTHRLLFGSAAVFIDFDDWQADSVVTTVPSPVLQDIDPESAGAAAALNLLNDLNRSFFFV